MASSHDSSPGDKRPRSERGALPEAGAETFGVAHLILVDGTAPEILAAVGRAAERLCLTPLVDRAGTCTGVRASPEDWARLWFEIEVDALVDDDLRRRDPARAALTEMLRQRRYAGQIPREPRRGGRP